MTVGGSVHGGAEVPPGYALALERELQSLLFRSGDAKEGIRACAEKNTPQFRGR